MVRKLRSALKTKKQERKPNTKNKKTNNIKSKQIVNIISNYNDPGHPIAYGGIQKIYKHYNGKIPLPIIQQELEKIYNYTIHKEAHKRDRNPYYVYTERQQFQIDLVDMQQLSKYNDNYKYLLTCIDVFTKKAFVRPCKSKKDKEVLENFKSILLEAGKYPKTVLSDKGSEIKNKLFNAFCNKNKIKQIFPENEVHASVVERFNGTLEKLIYKYMSENETHRYIDDLDDFVKTYNNRYHRSIKMTPNEAEQDKNHPKVFMEIDKRIRRLTEKHKNTPPKFKIGDRVRIPRIRHKFMRGYDRRFKDEIFTIVKVKKHLAVTTYVLKDYRNEIIQGTFYEFELSRVRGQKEYRIEKILKRKIINKEPWIYVKWKGYGDEFNKWIKEEKAKSI
jgi:hypothetical protein